MKKLLSLFLCLAMCCSVSFAQGRKSTRKTSKPKTTVKKQSTKTADVAKPAVKPNPVRVFEGTLVYASQEYHSAAVRKFSFGQAYNGTRETCITVSGNKIHIVDKTLCLHTIMDADANMCYQYSEITKTGVSYPLLDYRKTFSTLSKESRANKLTWENPRKTMYKGDELDTYHATISPKMEGVNNSGVVEIWSSPAFKVGEILNYAFSGIDLHGIVKKWLWETKGSAPIIGTLHSIVSSELVALSEYNVDKSVFVIPEGITIVPDNPNSCSKTVKFAKQHKKAMKKMGLTPVDDAEGTLPQIQSQWAFVQKVEDNENYTGDLAKEIWGEIGTSIISSAASLYAEEKEKWEKERMEARMQREMYEREQQMETAKTAPATRPSQPRKGKKQGVSRVREARAGVTTCTDPYLMSASFIAYMRNFHVAPGTVYDPNLHMKCIECSKFTGTCTVCGGMGFYKLLYPNIEDEDGTVHSGTSDMPMKGTKKDCSACKGNGVCHICGGSGKSSVPIMAGSETKKTCHACKGTKQCHICKGHGYKTYYSRDSSGKGGIDDQSTQANRKSVEKQVGCTQCSSSGKCSHCKGTRVYTYAGTSRPCDICNKTGKCNVCKGNKTVSVTARE